MINAGEAVLGATLIVYDDRNQNGKMDVGALYPQHPAMDASDAEWERFTRELQKWEERYGHLDFLQLSSPSDPNNEVVSRTDIHVIYLDNALYPGTADTRVSGYQLAWEKSECHEQTRQYEDGSKDSCKTCWSGLDRALDPGQTNEISVSWSLDES